MPLHRGADLHNIVADLPDFRKHIKQQTSDDLASRVRFFVAEGHLREFHGADIFDPFPSLHRH